MTPEQFTGFCRGNALKYLSRAGKKGDLLIDLEKAWFYLDYEIQTLREDREAINIPPELLKNHCPKHGVIDEGVCPLCTAITRTGLTHERR